MKKNGFTILELLVSIVILSIVLTFAMNLFLKVRSAYTHEKSDIEMEITRSVIIDVVMSDVSELGVKSVSCDNNTVTIRYNGDLTATKNLIFDTSNSEYDYIRYYVRGDTLGTVRKLPKGSIKGTLDCTKKDESSTFINTSENNYINHIYHRVEDENNNDYSIDLLFYSVN